MNSYFIKSSFITLSLSATMMTCQAADIMINVAGDANHIVARNGAMQISERQATELVSSMLYQTLLEQTNYQYSIASNDATLAYLGALPEDDGCRILAIELHFEPEDQPNGSGSGLWVATNPADKEANQIAQSLLDTWSSKKHSPYQGVPLHHKQPANYLNYDIGTACPSLYINLDTFTEIEAYSWVSQPQSIYNYAHDLAHAVAAALEDSQ